MAKQPDFSMFKAVTTTSMEILAYGTEEQTGAFIEGHTPDSSEWRELSRKRALKSRPQRLMLGKQSNYIELEKQKGEYSEEDLMLCEVITDIKGIPNYEFTPESAKELLLGDGYFILQQWKTHMDDRKNFLENAKPASNDG